MTGPNSSHILLRQDGVTIDTKSLPFNFEKISHNYDVVGIHQFCKEWLLPCVSIKHSEWVTSSLNDDKDILPSLQLQIHGEILSELIFKQFAMMDPLKRPTSAITELMTEEERD